ncbi:hypothetical protein ABER75_11940 [Niallia taxi]|uniref:hypothetical protein n=1 Tax=Niallia taxi TaxID=2499688 RepID=UPI003D2DA1BA
MSADICVVGGSNISFESGLKDVIDIMFGAKYSVISKSDLKVNDESPRLIVVTSTHLKEASSFTQLENQKRDGAKLVILKDGPELPEDLHLFTGFLSKNMSALEMKQAIEDILENNEYFVHPEVGASILIHYNRYHQNKIENQCI